MLRHCMGSGGEILQSMKKGAGAGGHSLSGQNMPLGGVHAWCSMAKSEAAGKKVELAGSRSK